MDTFASPGTGTAELPPTHAGPVERSFLWPASVAIVGASSDPAKLAGRPLDILRQHNYGGRIYLVNPRHPRIDGMATFPSVADIPEPVDVALILLPSSLVVDAVEQCARAGVGKAIVCGAGFGESAGEGQAAEAQLRAIAAATGLRIVGPNCQGFLNVGGGVAIGFSPAVDLRHGMTELPKEGPIAIVSQSGGIGFSIFQAGTARGLGFSYVISTGNEVDLDVLDYLEFLLDDSRTDTVVLFLEGLQDGRRFVQLAQRAADLGKTIVVVKVGGSEAGRRAAVSHTAHMTGSDVSYDAAFRRYGVLRAGDPVELIDLLCALDRMPTMDGDRVAVATFSGGAGIWVTDVLENSGFEVTALGEETRAALAPYLPAFGAVSNPVDTTAQIVDRGGLAGVLRILLEADEVDAVVATLSMAVPQVLEREEEALRAVLDGATKPLVVYSYTEVSTASAAVLERLRVPWYQSPTRAVQALRGLRTLGSFRAEEAATPRRPVPSASPAPVLHSGRVLCEYEVKEALLAEGVPAPRHALAGTEADAVDAATVMGFPVALKVQSPDLPHKRAVGGVALGLGDEGAVRDAYRAISASCSARRPAPSIHGLLVQEMVSPGVEMLVSRLADPTFGPVVVVGRGGADAEVLRDVVYELAPVSVALAAGMIRRLRSWPLLDGSDGRPLADVDALAELISRLSVLEFPWPGTVVELELNPVVVHEQGSGVSVVDARAVLDEG